ncbi:hypothetical protein NRB_51600 [Novosphingobium sp. 11B]
MKDSPASSAATQASSQVSEVSDSVADSTAVSDIWVSDGSPVPAPNAMILFSPTIQPGYHVHRTDKPRFKTSGIKLGKWHMKQEPWKPLSPLQPGAIPY